MSNYTPGPWEAWKSPKKDHSDLILSVDSKIVARLDPWKTKDCIAEAEGNARIMAAAPNMLLMLCRLYPIVCALLRDSNSEEGKQILADLRAVMNSALGKENN